MRWCWFARAHMRIYLGDPGRFFVERSKKLSKVRKLQIFLNVICAHLSLIFSVLRILKIAKCLIISDICTG